MPGVLANLQKMGEILTLLKKHRSFLHFLLEFVGQSYTNFLILVMWAVHVFFCPFFVTRVTRNCYLCYALNKLHSYMLAWKPHWRYKPHLNLVSQAHTYQSRGIRNYEILNHLFITIINIYSPPQKKNGIYLTTYYHNISKL